MIPESREGENMECKTKITIILPAVLNVFLMLIFSTSGWSAGIK
jgi:hypothetical protein